MFMHHVRTKILKSNYSTYRSHCNIFLRFGQVMLGGKNIEEGFGIAYRVIQVSCNNLARTG